MTNQEFKEKLYAQYEHADHVQRRDIEKALNILAKGGQQARRFRRDWERRSKRKAVPN